MKKSNHIFRCSHRPGRRSCAALLYHRCSSVLPATSGWSIQIKYINFNTFVFLKIIRL